MSGHRWQTTTPAARESRRSVCVVCDVLRVTRPTMLDGYETVYSRDGASWSSAAPDCKAPAHTGHETAEVQPCVR